MTAATLDYSGTGGGVVSYVDGIYGGYTVANGVVIENATTGSGDDTLTGNGANNVLRGNAGADVLAGLGGNDALYGGAGADQFIFDPFMGDDTVHDFHNNSDTLVFRNFAVIDSTGSPIDYATQQGDDVLFDFGGLGSVLVLDITTSAISNDISA